MPSGRRQRAVTEPLQAGDTIARSELCLPSGGSHVTVGATPNQQEFVRPRQRFEVRIPSGGPIFIELWIF